MVPFGTMSKHGVFPPKPAVFPPPRRFLKIIALWTDAADHVKHGLHVSSDNLFLSIEYNVLQLSPCPATGITTKSFWQMPYGPPSFLCPEGRQRALLAINMLLRLKI